MNNNKLEKEELEYLINEVKTLGNYIFNEDEECFFADAEVVICLKEIEDGKYISSGSYFFDGYEIGLSDDEAEKLVFFGNEDYVREKVLEQYSLEPEMFMNYPIIYQNVFVKFVEK
ncbi:MAG: hypothetical protein FWC47_11785 [Oscillospiraceae bacterium]|nr:hypothetical protein [Oscillospiraceae bacterium]